MHNHQIRGSFTYLAVVHCFGSPYWADAREVVPRSPHAFHRSTNNTTHEPAVHRELKMYRTERAHLYLQCGCCYSSIAACFRQLGYGLGNVYCSLRECCATKYDIPRTRCVSARHEDSFMPACLCQLLLTLSSQNTECRFVSTG